MHHREPGNAESRTRNSCTPADPKKDTKTRQLGDFIKRLSGKLIVRGGKFNPTARHTINDGPHSSQSSSNKEA